MHSRAMSPRRCGLQPQCVVLGGDAAETQEVGILYTFLGILYTLGIPMRDPRTMRLHRASTPPTR